MKSAMGIIVNRIAVCFQQTATLVDPAVLQWPGGSFIALLLLIRAITAAAFDSRRLYDV
jgi:hypothetical protein